MSNQKSPANSIDEDFEARTLAKISTLEAELRIARSECAQSAATTEAALGRLQRAEKVVDAVRTTRPLTGTSLANALREYDSGRPS